MYAEQYKPTSLLIIAILAGMAVAAGFVAVRSLRTLKDPLKSSSAASSAPYAKPSAFGAKIAPSSLPPDVKVTPSQIAKSSSRSIVVVTSYDQDDKAIAQGPGFVYSSAGIIVTSFSAIRGASSVTVETSTGEELNVIAVMGYSVNRELAVLAVLESNLPALETGAGDVVNEGDAITVIGPESAVSQGIVGTRRAIGGVDLMQITATASAGSPVLNDHGKVIGLATHRRFGGQTLTLAVPSHYISDLLAENHAMSFAQMLMETQPPTASSK